jgi:hypothetical protein
MASATQLKREARASCKYHDHTMQTTWHKIPGRNIWTLGCLLCGATAVVDPKPPSNGIDISGSAVATNCKKHR